MLKVLFVASEAAPFIKTGGLADVAGALPRALLAKGIDARVIIPKYGAIKAGFQHEMQTQWTGMLKLAWRQQYCGILKLTVSKLTTYFVDNEFYFKRNKLYGYGDDAERFAFFSRAVLAALPHLDFQPDIIHCNDWHTGMVGVYLREEFARDAFYKNIKLVYTIHNLKYQGIFGREVTGDVLGLPDSLFTSGRIEAGGCVNFLKSGLVYADAITTVSRTYAKEITYPYFGEKLDGYLRSCGERLQGILNGLDEDEYNPATDVQLAAKFDAASVQARKPVNKEALQKRLGLPVNRKLPLLVMVTRLVENKGMDLVLRILEELLQTDVQFAVLGTGDLPYEQALAGLARRYPSKMALVSAFDEGLSRLFYAGADIFVMPSRFEPCGLSQLIAMRYGTIPVVRETGGLKDSVQPFNKSTGRGNGLRFSNFNAHELLCTLQKALALYADAPVWEKLVHNAITSRNGWNKSATAYADLYHNLAPQPDHRHHRKVR